MFAVSLGCFLGLVSELAAGIDWKRYKSGVFFCRFLSIFVPSFRVCFMFRSVYHLICGWVKGGQGKDRIFQAWQGPNMAWFHHYEKYENSLHHPPQTTLWCICKSPEELLKLKPTLFNHLCRFTDLLKSRLILMCRFFKLRKQPYTKKENNVKTCSFVV